MDPQRAADRIRGLALSFPEGYEDLGRWGWVTATVSDDESLDTALEWLRESYWLRAPKELRHAAE